MKALSETVGMNAGSEMTISYYGFELSNSSQQSIKRRKVAGSGVLSIKRRKLINKWGNEFQRSSALEANI